MAGLFGILHAGTNGMSAAQAAMQTTSNNISNANTDGYSRQRVNLVASNPYTLSGVGQLGTGVRMESVTRIVDDYLVKQSFTENASLEKYTQKADVLGQLESVFNEPSETGLNNKLTEFYESWKYLGNNPELTTSKTMVSQQAQTLTDTISHMGSQLDSLQEGTVQAISKKVLDFNTKVEQLESINEQIFSVVTKGEMPNTLLDQRDKLVEEISGITSVEVKTDAYQRTFISIDGEEILGANKRQVLNVAIGATSDDGSLISTNGSTSKTVESEESFKTGTLLVQKTAEDGSVQFTELSSKSGHISGSQEALVEIDRGIQELNQLVSTVAKAVNLVHSDNGTGIAFFDLGDDPDDVLSNLKVNSAITEDPSKIVAGKSLTEQIAGDGTRAQAIADIQSTALQYSSNEALEFDADTLKITAQPNGTITADAYNDVITRVGISKQQADFLMENQNEVVSFLEQRKSSISGVSINEEVVNIMKFQSAFQANAKVLAITSEMLDTLINRTGV
jgi:flagellar hook-associated protein 1 FlgK